jgi:hypothetical protein
VYLYLDGILLLILGAIYAMAAREPDRYVAVAPLSAGGRALGFAVFMWAWLRSREQPVAFLALGLADLAIGVATWLAWRRATRLSD